MKKLLAAAVALCLLLSLAPAASAEPDSEIHTIVLSSTADGSSYSHTATLDGESVEEFDYTWHADPSEDHGEIKNAPAEYYTGTEPDTDAAAYIAHDIYYYPELPADSFKRVQYDDDQEWVYYYTADNYTDYIFATLPIIGSSVPTSMMHSEAEAYENAVLHITQAGTYILEGEWHGQIWIDLGGQDDTFADEDARVTVILNGVDVTCTVAPAIVFYSLYECDNTWEDQSSWSYNVDTTNAGANVIIADGTVNNFTGENVYRMLKTTYKNGQEGRDVPVQKKMRKLDGAFYSYVSMNIDGGENGTGVLNITAGFEGLDTELHLTINGGNINIFSQDDGMNVNEDGVSVLTINGGSTHVLAGLGSEGDGIDSNGYLVVNGGTVIALAKPNSDSGMDSDCGTYINGGTVVALGSTMDYASSDGLTDAGQAVMNLQFASSQSADEAIIVTDTSGKVVFAYDPDKDEVAGDNARWYRGAIVSAPGLQTGGNYYVYIGGDVTGTEVEGVYDVDTVTGFSSDAKQQCWSSTGSMGGFGGGMGGFRPGRDESDMTFPDSMEDGRFPNGQDWGDRGNRDDFFPQDGTTPPELPDGQQPQDGFDGTMPPGRPDGQQPQDGFDGTMPPDRPDGQQPQDGFDGTMPPDRPDGQQPQNGFDGQAQGGNTGDGTITFTMDSKVNNFSGVTDYSGAITDTEQPEEACDGGTDCPSYSFADLDTGKWYHEAVDYVIRSGLMNGYNGIFAPGDDLSRAMLAEILYNLEGKPGVTGSSSFADVLSDKWYAEAVTWAAANDIAGGYDGLYRPDDPVTREQLAAMFYRYVQYKDGSVSAEGNLGSFPDGSSVSGWGVDAMEWAVGSGLIQGMNGLLAPQGTADRAQIATILMRFCENIAK